MTSKSVETSLDNAGRKVEGAVESAGSKAKNSEAALPMKSLAAEVFGTFLLVFGGLGIGLFAGVQDGTIIPVALAFGFALMAGIYMVGHISGGHFNPAVTVGLATAKRFEWKNVLPYIAAQLVGAALAMGLLYLITLDSPLITSDVRSQLFTGLTNSYGDQTKIKFGAMAALLVEVAVTAIFVSVILAVTSKKASKAVQSAAPFAIGITLAIMIQLALPITNGSLNPARSTAAALTAPSAFGHLWLFWVGPILGGVIAGLVFNMIDNPGSKAANGTAGSAKAGAAAEAFDADIDNAEANLSGSDDATDAAGSAKNSVFDAADDKADAFSTKDADSELPNFLKKTGNKAKDEATKLSNDN